MPFHVMDNGNIMKGAEHTDGLENYFKRKQISVQEISPTRTEVRVISQNIDDENIRRFVFQNKDVKNKLI